MFGGFRGVSAYELNGEAEIDESLFSFDRPTADIPEGERKEIKITYFYEKDPKTVIVRSRLRTLKIYDTEMSDVSGMDGASKISMSDASGMDGASKINMTDASGMDGASNTCTSDVSETSVEDVPRCTLEHRDSCELARKRKTSKESDIAGHDSGSEDEDVESLSKLVRRTSFASTPVTIPNEIENAKSPMKKPLKALPSILRRNKESKNKDPAGKDLTISETKLEVKTNIVNSLSNLSNNSEEVEKISNTVKKTLTTPDEVTSQTVNDETDKEKETKNGIEINTNEPPKPPPRLKKKNNQKSVQNGDEHTNQEVLM